MPYSDAADLLVGDMIYPPGFDKDKYVTLAAEEMDSKLGYLYQIPLAPVNPPLPEYQTLLLKTINNKLASGRLIMDISVGAELAAVHAYGSRMVNEALRDLVLIANGDVLLDAVRRVDGTVEAGSRVPGVRNQDSESLVLGFENTVLRGEPWYSRPGVV